MEKKLKHLELIQGVINRLAANSFQMKGWTVVLVSAILVLLARVGRLDATCVAFLPILVFWGLDGYFLWQERLYRALYDHVRVLDDCKADFSMDTTPFRTGGPFAWRSTVVSGTLVPFYGGLTLVAAFVSIWLGGLTEKLCD